MHKLSSPSINTEFPSIYKNYIRHLIVSRSKQEWLFKDSTNITQKIRGTKIINQKLIFLIRD